MKRVSNMLAKCRPADFVNRPVYTVQYRDAVDSGQWNRLTDLVAAPTNRLVEVTDPAVGTSHALRVYRLATPRRP